MFPTEGAVAGAALQHNADAALLCLAEDGRQPHEVDTVDGWLVRGVCPDLHDVERRPRFPPSTRMCSMLG